MSYLENALTSNPTLGALASRSQKDVYAVIKMAESKRERTPKASIWKATTRSKKLE